MSNAEIELESYRSLPPQEVSYRVRPQNSRPKCRCSYYTLGTITIAILGTVGLTILTLDFLNQKPNLREGHMEKYSKMRESIKLLENTTTPICDTEECFQSALALNNSMNTSVDPCDDFYQFVCGKWSNKTDIENETDAQVDIFTILDQKSSEMTINILNKSIDEKDPKTLNAARIFFKLCTDGEQLEKDGLYPLFEILDSYGGLPLIDENWNPASFNFIKSFTDLQRIFSTAAIFEVRVNQKPNFNIIEIFQPSFFIPRSVLLEKEKYASVIANFRRLVVLIAAKIMVSPDVFLSEKGSIPKEGSVFKMVSQVEEMIEFERKIADAAKNLMTGLAVYAYSIELPLYKIDDFLDEKKAETKRKQWSYPFFDPIFPKENKGVSVSMEELLRSLFSACGISLNLNQIIKISDIDNLETILNLLKNTPKRTIANYLHFRMAYFMISETTAAMRDLKPSFSNREKSCASFAEENFGLAIGYKYIQNGFLTMSAKTDIQKLFDDILRSFRELLDMTQDWMRKNIHQEFMIKLNNLKSCIGFPDWIENTKAVDEPYRRAKFFQVQSEMDKTPGYLKKFLKIAAWKGDQNYRKLEGQINNDCDWAFAALVNAFYDKQRNNIDLPPGLLQFPIFAQNRPRSLNYGALGTIIGHELTHGYYIKDTNAVREKDIEKYISSRKCLVNHYDDVESLNRSDVHLSGQMTLDENFADVGGLAASYYSLLEHLNKSGPEEKVPGFENYDSEQLFYISFAHNWCSSASEDRYLNQLLADDHSPPRQRVLGALRNSKEFARAWKCPVGSKMNQNPHDKCDIF